MATGVIVIVFLTALISNSAASVFKVGDKITLECPRLRSTKSKYTTTIPSDDGQTFTYFPVLKRERTDASDGRNDSILISRPNAIAKSEEAVYCGDPATADDCQSLKNRTTAKNVEIESPKKVPSSGR